MTFRSVAHATARAAHWLAGWARDVVTSAEGKVNKDDLKAVAVKFGPRLITTTGGAQATASVLRETLVQQEVFVAAMGLIGAILWSAIEVAGRRASGPTPVPPTPLPQTSEGVK